MDRGRGRQRGGASDGRASGWLRGASAVWLLQQEKGEVKMVIIDLVLSSGHRVPDPSQDRRLSVLCPQQTKKDSHEPCCVPIVFPLETCHPEIFFSPPDREIQTSLSPKKEV